MTPTIPTVLALAVGLAVGAPHAQADEFPSNHLMVFSSDLSSVPFTGSVRLLDADGQEQRAIYGLANPRSGIIGPTGRMFVLSQGDDTVRVVSPAGEFGLIETVFPAGPAAADLTLGPFGHVFVASQGTDVIYKFDADGTLLQTIGEGSGLVNPAALAFGHEGHLFVASADSGQVHEFDALGVQIGVHGSTSSIRSAAGLVFGPDRRMYVSSPDQNLVYVFDADGSELFVIGATGGLDSPAGMAFGPDDHLHVVSRGDDRIHVFDHDGQAVRQIDPGLPDISGGISFAPYRFEVSFKTRLIADGSGLRKPDLEAVLSLSPGSQRMMLHFTDLDRMAGIFDEEQLVLHGSEARLGTPTGQKKRLFQGHLTAPDAISGGSASLSLLVSGKFGNHGWFKVKKAQGDFVRGSATAGTYGELRTGQLLD